MTKTAKRARRRRSRPSSSTRPSRAGVKGSATRVERERSVPPRPKRRRGRAAWLAALVLVFALLAGFVLWARAEGPGGGRRIAFEIPSDLAFPLRVSVRADGVEQAMQGLIWRERSCATCHSRDGVDEASNGRIFVEEESP